MAGSAKSREEALQVFSVRVTFLGTEGDVQPFNGSVRVPCG